MSITEKYINYDLILCIINCELCNENEIQTSNYAKLNESKHS